MNSQILSSTPQDIQLKALQDFCQRTRAGYISYPVAWIILALVTNQTDQVFLTTHTLSA